MKCLYCENEFEIRPNGKQGGNNRQLCYDCLPEGIDDKSLLSSACDYYLRKKISEEKIARGCDICGYNKCAAALDWHHPNDDKEYNPSSLVGKGNWEGYFLYKKETEKCQLLCANCHREAHDANKEEKIFIGSDKYEKFRKEVCDYYRQVSSLVKTGKYFHKNPETIKRILQYCKVPIKKENNRIPVYMLDKETEEIIDSFESVRAAIEFLLGEYNKGAAAHISQCLSGKRKNAYGYMWKRQQDY